MIKLSDRLMAVANMISPCDTVADVGCDHGFLSIYLIENQIAKRVYASDVNAGPIERALEHINEYHMAECIEAIQCDGLSKKADTIVIAGMGGRLIISIIQSRRDIADSAKALVLEPQSDMEFFRNSLADMGYTITAEDFVKDDGKFYPIVRAEKGHMRLKKVEAIYGPRLLEDGNSVLMEFLIKEREYKSELLEKLKNNDTQKSRERIVSLENELSLNKEALVKLHYYG